MWHLLSIRKDPFDCYQTLTFDAINLPSMETFTPTHPICKSTDQTDEIEAETYAMTDSIANKSMCVSVVGSLSIFRCSQREKERERESFGLFLKWGGHAIRWKCQRSIETAHRITFTPFSPFASSEEKERVNSC